MENFLKMHEKTPILIEEQNVTLQHVYNQNFLYEIFFSPLKSCFHDCLNQSVKIVTAEGDSVQK